MNAKTTFEHFIEKPHQNRLVHQERLMMEVTEMLTDVMKRGGVSRAELARRLGRSKAFVTQVLRGRHNMTMRTLGDLAWALNCTVRVSAAPEPTWSSLYVEGYQHALAQPWASFRYEIIPSVRVPKGKRPEAVRVGTLTEVAA